jgi:hypothetical protein
MANVADNVSCASDNAAKPPIERLSVWRYRLNLPPLALFRPPAAAFLGVEAASLRDASGRARFFLRAAKWRATTILHSGPRFAVA